MEGLVEVCEPAEVRIEFALNCKCRATARLRSLSPTTPVAFKIQTSSPNKFLVNPPSGLIPPLSFATFQVILKPQSHLPRSYPRSPSDRFLIKTAEFVPSSSGSTHPESVNSWFASRPYGFSTRDLKLKVAFVGSLLLQDAVTRGDLDAVRNLMKRQRSLLADLSPTQADSLLGAATQLLNPDDMITELGEAVFEASRRGDARQVEALLRRGGSGSVKYRDQYGLTAVHAAAFKGHKDVVLVLSELAGLDLDCEDEEGHVPLHMAAESGDIGTVQVLVEKGVNLNAVNKRGATPLYMARVWGYDDICQLLVSRGALYCLTSTSA
ncbi:structural molecule [Spatholobus suberectus]|nr:structural molecule [Spatholobus suberectus]